VKNPKLQPKEPGKCWVNETQKICYESREVAEGAARLAETEHGLKPGTLHTYKCAYGDHWHLAH